jgi:TRAP-type C4-dicarboxylate transport system permease small subunit
MERVPRRKGPLVVFLEVLVMVAMATLVIDVLLGVGTRQLGALRFWMDENWGFSAGFLPEGQIGWTEELARFLMVWAALLGAAIAFERGAHLGVDYLVGKFHPDTRRLARTGVHVLVVIFALLVMIKGGVAVVEKTMASGQTTPALGIRKWVVYAVLPLSGVFIIIFALRNLLADWRSAIREEER